MRKVLLLKGACRLAKPSWARLARAHDLELVDCTARSPDELLGYFADHDVVAIANTTDGVAETGGYGRVLDRMHGLGCIAHHGAGYDSIDAAQCARLGIQVSNTPRAVANATADTAFYLILGTLRNFGGLASSLRTGDWQRGIPLADEADAKTLGIIGLGGIGAEVRDKCLRLLDFSKIQYHNRKRAPPDVEKDSEYVDLDTLLRTSDVIYVSVPLSSATRHLLNRENLSKCKDGVYIVNTARGAVIDEEALVESLESGKVKSVGLDVFEHEPAVHPKLLENKNALLLPHVGTHTVQTERKMEEAVISNLEAFLETGSVQNLVPECQSLKGSL